MEEKQSDFEEETKSIIKIEEMSLEETQLAEQLYSSAGLDPVVDAGLKDYDKRLKKEDKLISRVFGLRGSDIRGYGEAVAKRVAFAVYALLNRQYGGKVGDLRSYIMTLQEERDRANARYDELMGRVAGILGEEYKDLRTDSKEFVERLTEVLGEGLKESRSDKKDLAERLADIDGLRSQIKTLNKEKEQLKEGYETQITELKNEREEEVRDLRLQISTLDKEKEKLKDRYESQITELKDEHREKVRDLRLQISTLDKEKEKLKDRYESQITELKDEHREKVRDLRLQISTLDKEKEKLTKTYESKIAKLDSKIEGLETENTTLIGDLKQLREGYDQLKKAMATLAGAIPDEEIGKKLRDELYGFILEDSKVPDKVIGGVGRFIDFKKYLGVAAERGAKEVCKRMEEILGRAA